MAATVFHRAPRYRRARRRGHTTVARDGLALEGARMTFSVVARDPGTGDLGVAVQSRFLAVGPVVTFARAGVGAGATQAWANVSYGPRGLDLLAAGASPRQAVDVLTGADDGRDQRQLGIVDAAGAAAAFTGAACPDWAGHVAGDGFTCQGNILVSGATVDAMAAAMGDLERPFPDRLVAALAAGQAAGGDARGQQSAAVLVVRPGGGYGGLSDRLLDLRVDDHPAPIDELRRLLGLHDLYFGTTPEAELLDLDAGLAAEVAAHLGRVTGDGPAAADRDAVWSALEGWAGIENLEERLTQPGRLDPVVLRVLRERAAEAGA
jgi:uncharacterized Ntn-hydrolase superfamily protein